VGTAFTSSVASELNIASIGVKGKVLPETFRIAHGSVAGQSQLDAFAIVSVTTRSRFAFPPKTCDT
jgi:hypothetical protein